MIAPYKTMLDFLLDVVKQAFPSNKINQQNLDVFHGGNKGIQEFLTTTEASVNKPTIYISYGSFSTDNAYERKPGAYARQYSILISLPPLTRVGNGVSHGATIEDITDTFVEKLHSIEGFRLNNKVRRAFCLGGQNLFMTLGIDVFQLSVVIE